MTGKKGKPQTTKGLFIETAKDGFVVWYDGRWILDASTLKKEGDMTICTTRIDKRAYLKNVGQPWKGHTRFIIVPTKTKREDVTSSEQFRKN